MLLQEPRVQYARDPDLDGVQSDRLLWERAHLALFEITPGDGEFIVLEICAYLTIV